MGKNPLIAGILSFILGGLGQIYLKKYTRAGFFFLLELATGGVYMAGQYYLIPVVKDFGQILNLLVSVWAAIDAYRIAKSSNSQTQQPKEQREFYV